MSTIMMSRCWPMRLPAVSKAVLISLADQANDEGVCWPSVATICDRTCYSERAVRKALRWLEAVGLLIAEIGAMRSNRYTLRPEAYRPGLHAVEVTEPDAPQDSAEAQPTRHHVPPGTSCPPAPRAPQPGTTCPLPRHHVPPNRNRTVIEPIPPLPPTGAVGPAEVVQTSKRKRTMVETLDQWLARCKASGQRPIPEGHPALVYADSIGLPGDIVRLHWGEFRARHRGMPKRQADWGLKFLNSLKGNWYGFWYIGDGGRYLLTTKGKQAMMAAGGRDAAE